MVEMLTNFAKWCSVDWAMSTDDNTKYIIKDMELNIMFLH